MTAVLAVLVASLALLDFVLKAEYPDWGRRVAAVLIRFATAPMPAPTKWLRREEWLAELAATQDRHEAACTGLTFALWIAVRYGTRYWLGLPVRPLNALVEVAPHRRTLNQRLLLLVGVLNVLLSTAGAVAAVGLLTALVEIPPSERRAALVTWGDLFELMASVPTVVSVVLVVLVVAAGVVFLLAARLAIEIVRRLGGDRRRERLWV